MQLLGKTVTTCRCAALGVMLLYGLLGPATHGALATPLAGEAAVDSTLLEGILRAESRIVDGDAFGAEDELVEALETLRAAPEEAREALLSEAQLALFRLEELWETTGELGACEAALVGWAELRATSPAAASVSAFARSLLGEARLAKTGSPEEARAAWAPLGCLEGWRVIGPFDNERGGGFATEYPPETELRPDATYDGKKREVAWRELPVTPLAGLVDLASILEPNEESLAYAWTHVRAEKDGEVLLLLGSDEGQKTWVNGQLVSSEDLQRRFRPDQTAVRVRLVEGWNSILVKVCQTTGPWRFRVRLAAPDGGPLDGVREGAPEEGSRSPRIEGDDLAEAVEWPVLAALSERVQADPGDARARYVQGMLLLGHSAHDQNEHPDTEALKQAVQLDPDSALYFLGLAITYRQEYTIAAQKDDNLWRQALESASSLGSAHADLQLARHAFETFNGLTEALDLVRRALRRNPRLEEAIRLRGEIEERIGLPRAEERALDLALELERRSPALELRRASRLASRADVAQAESVLRDLLAADARNANARAQLSNLCLHQGRIEECLDLIQAAKAIAPWDIGWYRRAATVAEGHDLLAGALEEIDGALTIRPESHELEQERARLLLLSNRKDQALAALGRALELQPNLPKAREYVEFLQATTSTFEAEFRRDVGEIVKRAHETADENPDAVPARVLLTIAAIEVNPDGTTKEFVQEVIQVLNDLGIRMFNSYRTYYAAGEQFLEFKKARVHHRDGTTSDARLSRHGGRESEFSSFRTVGVDLPTLSAGDVIEVEYVREDIAQSFFGDYFGEREVFQREIPIAEKTFYLRVPQGRRFYFHQKNLDLEPVKTVDEEATKVTYSWTLRDIPKRDPEPAMPDGKEISPVLEVSTFESWDAFTRWYWNLIKKQFEVSPEIARKVEEITSGKDSDLAKIRAVYNFVVSDIRYNAWEFGVHGFKPYNAATIFARRFGDCKDKATLMSVMLDQVGIKAWPVLIYADPSRSEDDLTLPIVNQFNHCISYVPPVEGRDELYLDGTAQFHSMEELPLMDRGAKVLIVRDDGGSIQQIPWNDPGEFSHSEEVTVILREDLGASLQVRGEPRGEYAVSIRRAFEIPAQRQTTLERAYGSRFAGTQVEEADFSDLADLDTPVSFAFALDVPRYAEEAPEGLVLPAPEDLFNSGSALATIASLESRDTDVILGAPRRSTLTTEYALPAGLRVKSLPPDHDISNRFGRLKVTYEKGDGKVRMRRLFELTVPRIAVADYDAFRELAATVTSLKDERIILERS